MVEGLRDMVVSPLRGMRLTYEAREREIKGDERVVEVARVVGVD